MKLIKLICVLLFCTTALTQEINQEITIENKKSFLVGRISVNGLSSKSYKTWYTPNYDAYEVNKKKINTFKAQLSEHKILVFMGTWCGDSKREIPRFIKILKAANFNLSNLKIVGLDYRKDKYKKSPTGEEWGLHIQRVPTIIFYKNGKEVNRIIERPITDLEEDIKAIVTQKPYTPNYATSLHFD